MQKKKNLMRKKKNQKNPAYGRPLNLLMCADSNTNIKTTCGGTIDRLPCPYYLHHYAQCGGLSRQDRVGGKGRQKNFNLSRDYLQPFSSFPPAPPGQETAKT